MSKEIEHRWCNQDFGKRGTLKDGNIHCDENSFYSYSTVIGQWLDKEKKLMAIIDDGLTPTTNGHVNALKTAVPSDVTVLYYHWDTGGWSGYAHVDTISRRRDGAAFDQLERLELVNLFITRLLAYFKGWKDSAKLTWTEEKYGPLRYWGYIETLNKMYGDCSLKKWVEKARMWTVWHETKEQIQPKRKMVRAYLAGKKPEEILDAIYGAGTYQTWFDRTNSLRKAEQTRRYLDKVTQYINGGRWYNVKRITLKEFKKMSGMDIFNKRMELMERRANRRYDSDHNKRVQKSENNAYKFLGYIERMSEYSNSFRAFRMPDGEILTRRYFHFHSDELQAFKMAKDKILWRNQNAKRIKLQAMLSDGVDVDYDLRFRNKNVSDLTEYEAQCLQFYRRRSEREKKYALALKERDEANRAAKEARIEALMESGVEGYREIWRSGLKDSVWTFDSDPDFYYGGNVLLRWNRGIIETSKRVSLTVKMAKDYFQMIKKWHDDPSTFSCKIIKTISGSYTVSSYENDILTAGCHKIAYVEMERMYNEILEREKKSEVA